MREDFLQFVWKEGLFSREDLRTCEGEPLEILSPGTHNTDAGPDFFNARIRIGLTVWAGNVEVHVRASDWNRHRHGDDASYRNTILHVVGSSDDGISLMKGLIPVLEIGGRIFPEAIRRFHLLRDGAGIIPCRPLVGECLAGNLRAEWLHSLAVSRLEYKTLQVQEILSACRNDWDETFYCLLARTFGMRVNAEPFGMLARSIPYRILARHAGLLLQVEAMLFGQAGFLSRRFRDAYPQQLKKEYLFLKDKYGLKPLRPQVWKFLRLRPANFPTIRIAQLAAVMGSGGRLPGRILDARSPDDLETLLRGKVSPYWTGHYVFDKPAGRVPGNLGSDGYGLILINAIIPLLYAYGKLMGKEVFVNKSLSFLRETSPEQNRVMRAWQQAGIMPENALESQALLHLRQKYCDEKRCMACKVGQEIVSKKTGRQ